MKSIALLVILVLSSPAVAEVPRSAFTPFTSTPQERSLPEHTPPQKLPEARPARPMRRPLVQPPIPPLRETMQPFFYAPICRGGS